MALHTTTKELAGKALSQAERDYANSISSKCDVTPAEVETDLVMIKSIATDIASLIRRSQAAYRITNAADPRIVNSVQAHKAGLLIAEILQEALGFGAADATLLDAAVVVETV